MVLKNIQHTVNYMSSNKLGQNSVLETNLHSLRGKPISTYSILFLPPHTHKKRHPVKQEHVVVIQATRYQIKVQPHLL